MVMRFYSQDFFHSDNLPFDIHSVQFDEPDFEFHRHTFSEMVVVLRGFGTQITDFGEEPLYTGDVYVFNGEMGHGFKGAEGLLVCNVIYDPAAMLQPISADILNGSGFQALFKADPDVMLGQTFPSRLQLSADKLIQLEEMLTTIQLEYAAQSDGYEMMARANFLRMVVFLSRNYQSQPDRRGSHELAAVMQHINRRYLDPLRLDDLAAIASMSVSHFTRVFKQCFATSPMDYVIRLRMLRACELLRETSSSIGLVAATVGFKDSNYFARQFKQVIGATPTQYRRSMQFADPLQISEFKRNYPEYT